MYCNFVRYFNLGLAETCPSNCMQRLNCTINPLDKISKELNSFHHFFINNNRVTRQGCDVKLF